MRLSYATSYDNHKEMKYAICFCCVIALFAWNQHAFSGDIPEIKKDCTICHGSHGMASKIPGGLLVKPVPELCAGCHPARVGSNEHPIGMVPSMQIPQELPLDDQGQVTCITCHAPHGKEGYPDMLRKPPAEICQSCHDI
jgi:predicted CXXCH cytochrome family protein